MPVQKRQPTAKKLSGQLDEWMGICYDRELDRALHDLDRHFDAWRRGELHPVDLSEHIHRFHQGPARQLFSKYQVPSHLRAEMLAHAILDGLVDESELSDTVREAVRDELMRLRARNG